MQIKTFRSQLQLGRGLPDKWEILSLKKRKIKKKKDWGSSAVKSSVAGAEDLTAGAYMVELEALASVGTSSTEYTYRHGGKELKHKI